MQGGTRLYLVLECRKESMHIWKQLSQYHDLHGKCTGPPWEDASEGRRNTKTHLLLCWNSFIPSAAAAKYLQNWLHQGKKR